MIRVHKIRLYPNNKQATSFAKACGVARFAYNWALSEWKRRYEAGETVRESILWKELNTIKREQYPWMLEVAKCIPQLAVKSELKDAISGFLSEREESLKYRKKGVNDSFSLSNSNFVTKDKKVWISLLGWVNMAEELRFDGENILAAISKTAEVWYITIQVAVPDPEPMHTSENQAVGISFGSESFAVLSDGTTIGKVNANRQTERKLKRLSKELSRRQGAKKGETKSRNYRKTKRKLSRLYTKMGNIRANETHRQTTGLTRQYGVIGVENIVAQNGISGNSIARIGTDMEVTEFLRQLEYKAAATGSRVVVANRWSPSSRKCHACGYGNEGPQLLEYNWVCAECGAYNERDINAAIKLRDYAVVVDSEQETP